MAVALNQINLEIMQYHITSYLIYIIRHATAKRIGIVENSTRVHADFVISK